tara:strand:+ start:412 stop:714 length:303 start_codon:yes stop_codon:yes gene_type:complete
MNTFEKKRLMSVLANKEDIEHITDAMLNFVKITSAEVGLDQKDVSESCLVALLLFYIKNHDQDKTIVLASLMSLLSSVFLITSNATAWVEIEENPEGGIN